MARRTGLRSCDPGQGAFVDRLPFAAPDRASFKRSCQICLAPADPVYL